METIAPSTLEEVQAQGLSMLKEISEVLEKNNLRYLVFFGTLLGTIRHKGTIPWDDDIDITMPREDMEKLREIAPEIFNENYFYQDYTSDAEYPSIYSKIRNNNTTFIEEGYKKLRVMNHGMFVDIFPADWYDVDLKTNPYKLKLVKTIKSVLISQKCWYTSKPKKLLAALFPRNLTFKFVEKLFKGMDPKGKHTHRYIFSKPFDESIFDDYIMADYGNIKVRVPRDYDKCLTQIYGDYMKLPPIERQKPIHMTDYSRVDIPYKEYIEKYL